MTNDDNIVVASNYRMIAGVYERSAKILAKSEDWNDQGQPSKLLTPIPIYQLCSHAAELYLKASLLKRGYSEKEMKKFDYRHNLQALLNLLIEKEIPISNRVKDTVASLSEQHQNHILRYSKIENGFVTVALHMPPIEEVFESLGELLELTSINRTGK